MLQGRISRAEVVWDWGVTVESDVLEVWYSMNCLTNVQGRTKSTGETVADIAGGSHKKVGAGEDSGVGEVG